MNSLYGGSLNLSRNKNQHRSPRIIRGAAGGCEHRGNGCFGIREVPLNEGSDKGFTVGCYFGREDRERDGEGLTQRRSAYDIIVSRLKTSGMILTGTPEQVKAYCKNLIDVAGKGGGHIMSFGTSMDEGRPDTIHAMVNFTKEYGVYK